ncbi:MAG: putative sugar nucleotidyl transferase [Sphingobacterium sp.]|uniref:putative sugar nucleotidyl transferase n=1 Tax=Sphingobacterium sp. JB170 TaxID=1434842 RepID=UPI00097E9C05|nr:putative sugar nucleotidyl transferase [Sphingobacterium sp. JB170]SJN49153.1 Glucose-1-phosphate thymidylyltransferase [Sphingobacterium sp. JB170]
MLEIVLHDRAAWRKHFLPLVFTRPVGELRVGILTFREKWQLIFGSQITFYTEQYLQSRFPSPPLSTQYLVIAANIFPNKQLIEALSTLPDETVLEKNGHWLAYRTAHRSDDPYRYTIDRIQYGGDFDKLSTLTDIFIHNRLQIELDYTLLISGKESSPLDRSNFVHGDQLFVGKHVEALASTFNTVNGPIFIDDHAVIEQGCHIKGPVAIGSGSRLKMGSKIYPNVTIGPGSTVSGEINNTVIWGNSAKGHDGYLGCSVIGECCNIGAGTNNSNLQNNWGEVSVYDYSLKGYRKTGQAKVGVVMGDYAMCGINSAISTGTIIGVGAQIAKSNIIPKFVADFTWLTDFKQEEYRLDKFESMLESRAKVRKEAIDERDVCILREVYTLTEEIRKNL